MIVLKIFKEGGGGVISDPKNFVAFFSEIWGEGNNDEFSEKGGHANPNEFCCKFSGLPKKNAAFFSENRGGSEAVWKFSENSSNLFQAITPYLHLDF